MNKFIVFLATGFYSGFVPFAPGTFGSLVGLILYLPLKSLNPFGYFVFVAAFLGVGVVVSTRAENLFKEKDSRHIVIDEIVGLWISLFLIPEGLGWLLSGFILFRIFDIIKPLSSLEKIKGGWGVMLDDVAAGIITNLCLLGINYWV